MKKLATIALAAGLGACTTAGGPHKLTVRQVGRPAAASVAMPFEARLNEGAAELALGNIGLAIERFRVAARDNPLDPRPLQGLAACYERMGRPDLSRRYLEQALALAPRSTTLMAAEERARTIEKREEAQGTTPVQVATAAVAAPVMIANAPVIAQPPIPVLAKPEARARGPRLVRMSLGEVALVSSSADVPFAARPDRLAATMRGARVEKRSATATLKREPAAAQAPVRLLNAARTDRLAARTRQRLGEFGWRRLTIGDAPAALAQTVIRYPAEQRTKAVMLALAFRKARLEQSTDGAITILLGRDTARFGLARE